MASNTQYEKYKSDGSLQGNVLEWVDARRQFGEEAHSRIPEILAGHQLNEVHNRLTEEEKDKA